MLCQYCGKNPATTFIRTISDGKLAQVALCAECAQKLGCSNFFDGLGDSSGDVLHELFAGEEGRPDAVRCECCGASFFDIVRSGRVGCAQCYRTFYSRLAPIIRQIHGGAVHRGKAPGGSLPQVRPGGRLAVRVRRRAKPLGGHRNGGGTLK